MSLWLDLLGKPFKAGARGPEAYDCVGVLLAIQHRLGHPLPAYTSDLWGLAAARGDTWDRVTDPKPGDAILIRSSSPPWHVGVVCGGGYMIHAHCDAGAVTRVRYDAHPWHKRIEGFYRWNRRNIK